MVLQTVHKECSRMSMKTVYVHRFEKSAIETSKQNAKEIIHERKKMEKNQFTEL